MVGTYDTHIPTQTHTNNTHTHIYTHTHTCTHTHAGRHTHILCTVYGVGRKVVTFNPLYCHSTSNESTL